MADILAAFFRRSSGGLAWLLVLGLAAGGVLGSPAPSQDAGALARQANTELRQAERSMFAGKLDEAQRQLDEATQLIEQVRAADPAHAQLASLTRNRDKLAADLSRRVTKDPKSDADKQEPKPESKDLPGGVTKRLADMDRELARLRGYMERDSAASVDSRVQTASGYLDKAKASLAEIVERYGDQVPEDHPDLVAARARLAGATEEIRAFEARLTEAVVQAAAPKPVEAGSPAADRAIVEDLYERFAEPLDLVHGNTLVYGPGLEQAEQAVQQIREVESNVLPELQPALAVLVERYGEESMAIDNKLHEMGVPPGERFATKMETLIRGVRNVARSRTASAESIARNAEMALSGIDRLMEEIRVARLEETKAILVIGQELDPGNQPVHAMLADIDERIAATGEQIEKDIDSRKWAGHVTDFPGPGEVEALSAAAKAWFSDDERWGRHPSRGIEILAVGVRGPWQVAERDVFGRVIRWRLPIHLAITDSTMREKGLARVYELSQLALEGPPNDAAKAPPFDGYWVGESWAMRLAAVPSP